MADKMRAVIVGSGWGRNHALGLKQSGLVDVVAVCGRIESERGKALAEEFGVPLFTDVTKALAELSPDIATVATQEAEHHDMTIAALEAGAHVYCEKVMAATISEAEAMIAAAEEEDRQLMVGYNYRFSPSAERLRQVVKGGELGEVLYGSVQALGYCIHHATHTVLSILGEPDVVFAMIDREERPGAHLKILGFEEFIYSAATSKAYLIKFKCGAVVTFVSSDYQKTWHPAVQVDLGGTDARVQMNDIVGDVILYKGDRIANTWKPSQIRDKLDLASTTQKAVGEFARALLAGTDAPVPAEEGLSMMRLEKAIQDSANSASAVHL